MFKKLIAKDSKIAELEEQLAIQQRMHQMRLNELEAEHKIELREKDFQMKHAKDEEVVKLQKLLAEEKERNAVLNAEKIMLDRIVDLNGDIVDVKSLVERLIDKLPQIDLKSLTVNNHGGSNNS